ncbi:integrase core domain protein, partial [Oesophagostomum dentatum]
MKCDIAQYVMKCELCQSRKDPSAYRMREPLQCLPTATRPWQRVHSDIIGPLSLTLDGNKYIIMFVDAFSKHVTVEALPDQKANTTMQTFINRFVARFGLPETLVTDQGSNYVSDGFRSLLRNLHIHHRTSTPYHHESNGQVERANRTLEELIAMATKQYHDEWDQVLQLMIHAYNSTQNSSTKYSPFFLIHGCEPTNIFQLALKLPTRKYADPDDYVNHLTNILQAVYHNVHGNIAHAQEQQKHHYDLRKRPTTRNYQTGTKIWIRRDNAHKIAPKFEGPYPVVDVNPPNVT